VDAVKTWALDGLVCLICCACGRRVWCRPTRFDCSMCLGWCCARYHGQAALPAGPDLRGLDWRRLDQGVLPLWSAVPA
jgi:hypothetical protein